MQARILDGDKIRTTTVPAEIRAALAADQRIWIDLERQNADADALLSDVLKLHPLTIEDIWAERSRPKIDDFDHYLYVIVHSIGAAKRDKLKTVEIDVVIGPNWLVTHDPAGLVSDDVGDELDHSARVMAKGVAWLAHAVLDRAVDRYMPIIDQLDADIEQLENDVLERAGTRRGRVVLLRILNARRRLQELRRMSFHQREILLRLSRGDFDEIPADILPFLRDVYDHFLRINDIAEGYRDLITSALDAYLSVQSNRMNEIMKTLTLMSTVMLPLTFIVGLYGMNFKHMPELEWVWGYPGALGLMAIVAASILLWFRRRGWLGGRDDLDQLSLRRGVESDGHEHDGHEHRDRSQSEHDHDARASQEARSSRDAKADREAKADRDTGSSGEAKASSDARPSPDATAKQPAKAARPSARD